MTESGSTTYPGARLGLPEEGTGSVASWGRRIAALAVDWAASLLVAALFFGSAVLGQGAEAWAPMGVFLVQKAALTTLLGGSFGQQVLRLAVVRLDPSTGSGRVGRPVDLLQALLRSALVCLVVPPLIANRDRRGLHDLAVGSVTLRR